MNRRWFLGALLGLPFIRELPPWYVDHFDVDGATGRVLYVGRGDLNWAWKHKPHFRSVRAALAVAKPGSVIMLAAGHYETVTEPLDVTGMRLVGS